MTSETTAPRATHDGDPCPHWCTRNHERLLIDGKPEYGYADGHYSNYLTDSGKALVKIGRFPKDEQVYVYVDRWGTGPLTAGQAEELAAFLAGAPTGLAPLIEALYAAAAAAGEAA